MSFPAPIALVLAFAAAATAQVATGDIAISGFSTTTFRVLAPGGSVTNYVTPGFQGSGLSQDVLFDRQSANAFLIGGAGFVGRATITGPGTSIYALLTANVGTAVSMAWDDAGQVVFVDSSIDQIRRLDPATGGVVDLSSGPQPWGSELASLAFHPPTGNVIAGDNGGIHRLTAGSSTGVPVTTGLGGVVSGLAFDPVTGDIIATVLTVNRVIRVDGSGTVTDVAPPGSVPGPNGLCVDQNGDFVTGGGTGQTYRVPRTGGTPVFLGSNGGPLNGLAVAGAGGYALPYGAACNALFGPSALAATGPFQVGATAITTSVNHAANAPGILILGLSRSNHLGVPLPFLLDPLLGTASCYANASLDVTIAGTAGPGAPAPLAFPLALLPAFAGQTFFAQHACLEPVPGLLSWSNGLQFRVP
ncbi:MAG: hypothetical protein WAT39_07125 [Planctomycetota bacterium]